MSCIKVEYEGIRDGRHRFRFPRKMWDAIVRWSEANEVAFRDDSTMFHTLISMGEDDAVQFRLRWEGVTPTAL